MVILIKKEMKKMRGQLSILAEYTNARFNSVISLMGSLRLASDNAKEDIISLIENFVNSCKDVEPITLEVENICLKTTALFHPVAGDLRFVFATMKMCYFFKEINNEIKNIAEKVKFIITNEKSHMLHYYLNTVINIGHFLKTISDKIIKLESENLFKFKSNNHIANYISEIRQIKSKLNAIIGVEVRIDPNITLCFSDFAMLFAYFEKILNYLTNIVNVIEEMEIIMHEETTNIKDLPQFIQFKKVKLIKDLNLI